MITKLLADNAITKVISITRKSLNLNHAKLQEVLIPDLSQIPNHMNELEGDIYFCCLGTTIKDAGTKENFKKVDFDAIVNFGKVAETHKAQSFVLISASMANPRSNVYYTKIKGETEAALLELTLNRLIIFRPGLLIGERKTSRPAERISIGIMKALSLILPSRLEKTMATSIDVLAGRMLKEAKNPAHKIKIINAVDI